MKRNSRVDFYRRLVVKNLFWIRAVSVWAAVSVVSGFVSFIIFPEAANQLLETLRQTFQDILGTEELQLGITQVWLIFKNNLTVAVTALFLGVVFGIVPVLVVVFNFFIFGFLLALFTLGPEQDVLSGLFILLLSVIPHAVFEIPAFLIAAGFGLRLGFFWQRQPKEFSSKQKFIKVLKQNAQVLPLLIVLFGIAALVEIFITGNLVRLFVS